MIRPLCLLAALVILVPGCIEFQRAFSGQGGDDGGVDFGPVVTADGDGGGNGAAEGDGAGANDGNNAGADGGSDGSTGDGTTADDGVDSSGDDSSSGVGDTGGDAGDDPGDVDPGDDGTNDGDMGDVDMDDEMDGDTDPDRGDEPTDGIPELPEGLETTTTESGLQIIVIEEGAGALASPQDIVLVDYAGWIEEDETLFDTSLDGNDPFRFTLGAGQVIAGWDEGVLGMLVGEKRRLIIPSELGYGETGFADLIPPNATLVFDVTLVDIEDNKPGGDEDDDTAEGGGTGDPGGNSGL